MANKLAERKKYKELHAQKRNAMIKEAVKAGIITNTWTKEERLMNFDKKLMNALKKKNNADLANLFLKWSEQIQNGEEPSYYDAFHGTEFAAVIEEDDYQIVKNEIPNHSFSE